MKNIFGFSPGVMIFMTLIQINFCFDNISVKSSHRDAGIEKKTLTVAFYNVENLFYPGNDSLTNDDEFTPQGSYYWTFRKYYKKLNDVAKVLIALSDERPPAIIGLCEIEGRKVLQDLTERSVLKKLDYRFIHKESPDKRGIDVALLYDSERFEPVSYELLNIPDNNKFDYFYTRDILHVEGRFKNGAKVHFFINHWPSRRGGAVESAWRRELMASLLKAKTDTIFKINPKANIIIMGDFNDEPVDFSISSVLYAKSDTTEFPDACLFNLMAGMFKEGEGTHFRMNNFIESSLLDQVIISKSLISSNNSISIMNSEAHIFKNDFLINEKNGLPFRTYQGLKYLGGFSDHFPVYIKLLIVSDNEN